VLAQHALDFIPHVSVANRIGRGFLAPALALVEPALFTFGRFLAPCAGVGFAGSNPLNGLDNGGIPSGRVHGRGGMKRVCHQGQCSERRTSVLWY